MKDRFKTYIDTFQLCKTGDKILAAVSGGIDSMVMLNLFIETGYNSIGIAHCNFRLRNEESDDDQKFVAGHARKLDVPFFTTSFETGDYAAGKRISIQMAARELRYEWLESIMLENGYDHIAVGHNSDDAVETFFINLIRNSGIHGLSGIKPKNRKIIRPLLFASRKEITAYAKTQLIDFREDSSNRDTKYLRNKIRHKIIPAFEKLNPSFIKNMHEVMSRLGDLEVILADLTQYYKHKAFNKTANQVRIDFNKFPSQETMRFILYEMLKEFGFNGEQVNDIVDSVHGESGKQFFSDSFRLVKDREEFIIKEKTVAADTEYELEAGISKVTVPIKLIFKILPVGDYESFRSESDTALLDLDKLTFPLKLRKWKKGDRFMPFGMQNYRKLSDYFIDNKLSLIDKSAIWLLESDKNIVWVVNHRIDNRYRITEDTRRILRIRYTEI